MENKDTRSKGADAPRWRGFRGLSEVDGALGLGDSEVEGVPRLRDTEVEGVPGGSVVEEVPGAQGL